MSTDMQDIRTAQLEIMSMLELYRELNKLLEQEDRLSQLMARADLDNEYVYLECHRALIWKRRLQVQEEMRERTS